MGKLIRVFLKKYPARIRHYYLPGGYIPCEGPTVRYSTGIPCTRVRAYVTCKACRRTHAFRRTDE